MWRNRPRVWAAAGVVAALLAGARLWAGVTPHASAHVQAQPPRPSPVPTKTTHKHTNNSAAATGRITGTVIDHTTGAPAPNITVNVGKLSVKTDNNGNYDRQALPAGTYIISLSLNASQGVAEQNSITITLAAGATMVQHLAFRSPIVQAGTPAPVATPATLVPAALPRTGAPEREDRATLLLGMLLLVLGAALMAMRCGAQ